MYGVNLGGWLVTEKWMTPSVYDGFEANDEYSLVQTQAGRISLRRHHRTFMTEDDIRWLAEKGVEVLRVPFGYWIFGDAKPYVGAIERLDWIVDVAAKYGMQVLLDLHGAPESQNGKVHSGNTTISNDIAWLDNRYAQLKTVDVLVRIAARYRDKSNIWGIELLNEPTSDRFGLKLAWFYRRAYKEIIRYARPGTRIVFSDGYQPMLLNNAFGWMAHPNFPAVLDMHVYHTFGAANKKRSFKKHLQLSRLAGLLVRFISLFQPVIIGEWSNALPYATSPSQTRQFSETQQKGFRASEAVFYWSYKTESGGKWNFRAQIESGQLHI